MYSYVMGWDDMLNKSGSSLEFLDGFLLPLGLCLLELDLALGSPLEAAH